MIVTETIIVGDLETNCYLISDTLVNQTLIIDPGDDADFITQRLLDQKLKPSAIILTHGHFDHVLGCLELKLNFDIPIMLHKNDLKLYSSANQSALHWLKRKTLKVPTIDQFIKDGDKIKFGDESLVVIETPGHTPGSISLYDNKQNLFSGDLIFKDGVGSTNHSYSSPLDLQKSLKKLSSRLKWRDPSTSLGTTYVYPGHGPSFTQT